jgi:hypothetical protein
MSVRDGYGPIVSVGVTMQALLVEVVVAPVVEVSVGAAGESPHAAATPAAAADPRAAKAERRLILLFNMFAGSCVLRSIWNHSVDQTWRKCGSQLKEMRWTPPTHLWGRAVTDRDRTETFAWYTLVGSIASVAVLSRQAWIELHSVRASVRD